jgi:microcystin-dependent protein
MPEQNMLIPKSIDSGENGSTVFKPGHIISYLGTVIPEGWLLCNGQTISKTTYQNLWNAVKHSNDTYPYGSTSTTFTLPNLSNRFLYVDRSPSLHQGGQDFHSHGSVSVNGTTDVVATNHSHNQSNSGMYAAVWHGHADGGGYIGPNGSGSTADANKTGSGGSGVGPGAGHIHDGTANTGTDGANAEHNHGISVGSGSVSVNHLHNFTNSNTATANGSSNVLPMLRVNFIIKV